MALRTFTLSFPSTHLIVLSHYMKKHNALRIGNRIGEYYTDTPLLLHHQPIQYLPGHVLLPIHYLRANKFHYRFSPGDRVQIISGKHKGATGTVDANVFQRSVDFPNDHLPCHHVLLDNRLVITINVNQVEVLHDTLPYHQQL